MTNVKTNYVITQANLTWNSELSIQFKVFLVCMQRCPFGFLQTCFIGAINEKKNLIKFL